MLYRPKHRFSALFADYCGQLKVLFVSISQEKSKSIISRGLSVSAV